jgi:N-acetylneuraminic acid mutarotase
MRTSPSRIVTTIVVGLLVAACASAPSMASNTTPSSTQASASASESASPSASPFASLPSASIPARAPTWTATGSMSAARIGHTATLRRDGSVLVVGGYDGEGPPIEDAAHVPLATAEVYDPASGRWSATASMSTARAGHTATLLPDGGVLVVGGGGEGEPMEGGPRSATAELYDPGTGTWSATGSMTEARNGFSATLLANGTVLVAGGGANYREAELYDPSNGTWTATGNMAEGRKAHSATLLLDGTVLVAGGCACSEPPPTDSAERYDPNTGEWTTTGRTAEGRMGHAAILLADGRVLVAADGLFGDTPDPTELYDPSTGRWTAVEGMVYGRVAPSMAALSDGRVLATGGYDRDRVLGSEPPPLASAELYDPATQQWTATADMGTARADHTMTLLSDGRVLVVGGGVATDARSAELFDPGTE